MATSRAAARALPDLSRLTFLIVEDSRDFRELLADLLRACGAVVIETDNVRSAREHVATRPFDMIVTDLRVTRRRRRDVPEMAPCAAGRAWWPSASGRRYGVV
jgi:response regulator RpfG family c-di-GMP phosphodiesterase